MSTKEKRPTFFSVPINQDDITSKDMSVTDKSLSLRRSIYDRGGPTEPVRSSPRSTSSISANKGLTRLKETATSDSPLAQWNPIDAIFGSGALEGIGSLDNIDLPGVNLAGVPFSAYKDKGVSKLFHGTQREFEKFDPSKYDKGDVLGWLTHFAEDPNYANDYAMGASKGIKYISPSVSPDIELPEYWDSSISDFRNINPKILPAEIGAKNVLDLVDPNTDDLSQAISFLNPEAKRQAITLFKQAKKDPSNMRGYLKSSHYPNIYDVPQNEVPARVVASAIRLDETGTNAMPFDAIRYHDANQKSWAVPAKTPIKSIFGAALNDVAEESISPIKMIKHDGELSTGRFPELFKKEKKNDWWGTVKSMDGGQLAEKPDWGKFDKVKETNSDNQFSAGGKKFNFDNNGIQKAKEHLNNLFNHDNISEKEFNANITTLNKYDKNINKPHGMKTPYIVKFEDGVVHGGSGDKEGLESLYGKPDEGYHILPNEHYQIGNGDNNKPFNWTDDDLKYLGGLDKFVMFDPTTGHAAKTVDTLNEAKMESKSGSGLDFLHASDFFSKDKNKFTPNIYKIKK